MTIDEQLTLIWDEVRAQLRQAVNDATYRLWFERTIPVGLEDGVFVVGVPNDFARDWIDTRFATIVRDSLTSVLGTTVEVRAVVDDRATRVSSASPPPVAPENPVLAAVAEEPDIVAPVATGARGLNPRYHVAPATAYRELRLLEQMGLIHSGGDGKRALTEDGMSLLESLF